MGEKELVNEKWVMYLNEKLIAVIDSYTYLTRPSKRHGWKIEKQYERIFGRNSTIKIHDVPFDENVISEVKAKIIDLIQIKAS